jgi:hypothetical protein
MSNKLRDFSRFYEYPILAYPLPDSCCKENEIGGNIDESEKCLQHVFSFPGPSCHQDRVRGNMEERCVLCSDQFKTRNLPEAPTGLIG